MAVQVASEVAGAANVNADMIPIMGAEDFAYMLEVGLGGRFDATNVIANPACTVVTPVSLDHAEYLGDTVTKIAGEKAGIFKRGAPAVIAPQEP
eukprot:gene4699-6411_t